MLVCMIVEESGQHPLILDLRFCQLQMGHSPGFRLLHFQIWPLIHSYRIKHDALSVDHGVALCLSKDIPNTHET
jgi:hypothetical protein